MDNKVLEVGRSHILNSLWETISKLEFRWTIYEGEGRSYPTTRKSCEFNNSFFQRVIAAYKYGIQDLEEYLIEHPEIDPGSVMILLSTPTVDKTKTHSLVGYLIMRAYTDRDEFYQSMIESFYEALSSINIQDKLKP